MITIIDIAWLAGLLEGEGCFNYRGAPRIDLCMTDEDVVSKARNLIRKETKIAVVEPKLGNRKTVYKFTVSGNIAIQWMMTLYSLLGRRRKEKIRDIIKLWKAQQSRDKGVDHCLKGHPLLVEDVDYFLSPSSSGNMRKRCIPCNDQYHEKYESDRLIKTIAQLHGISVAEAHELIHGSNRVK